MAIESVMQETRVFPPPKEFAAKARLGSMEAYQAMCKEAEANDAEYWAKHARQEISWKKPFTRALDESKAPFYKWFDDGLLNVSYNCLDRHLENGNADKVALIFEADGGEVSRVTYRDLYHRVCRLANAMKAMGYKKGDRALIYMPMSVEGVVAMQACARLGLIHSVVFGGFSAKSLQERVVDAGATLIIAEDEKSRGGKAIPLKPAVDEAFGLGGCEAVRHVIVYRRTGGNVSMTAGRDVYMDDITKNQPDTCEPEWVEAEHPLFILYTSGSTGKPKGVQHSSGGYLLHAIMTMKYTFDIQASDIFWCTADIGWVIQDHKVSIFYTAPTAIRSLIKASEATPTTAPKHYNLSSLRLLGSVGEPINPEAWMWYYNNVGGARCPIVDTFWQTETGGHMITPMPGATPLVPGSCTLPFPGIQAAIVDEAGHDVPNGQGGILVVKRPWPSMIRTIWGDPDRFVKSYYPEELGGRLYLAGDGAIRDKETGYFTIMGRIDDVLNVSGHRMGTMEIESALVANPLVAEAAVVGRPDETTGEAVVAFVVLKGARPSGDDAKKMANDLRNWVGKEIGPIAKPKEIRFGDNLPKTRSGKIMRRLLRTLAKGEEITQDTSTLENPAILDQLKHSA